eukprot:Amastigsp_a512473_4.p4 type:complete len:121 gc:universal Amastigsp_a512473_4:617-255(-)
MFPRSSAMMTLRCSRLSVLSSVRIMCLANDERISWTNEPRSSLKIVSRSSGDPSLSAHWITRAPSCLSENDTQWPWSSSTSRDTICARFSRERARSPRDGRTFSHSSLASAMTSACGLRA